MRLLFMAFIVLLLVAASGQGQEQATAPVYKDGDWWKVKVEVAYYPGWPREFRCDESYPEYMVKIEQGKPKVYGVKGEGQEETECSVIVARLLAADSGSTRRLTFPLTIGKTWRDRVQRSTATGGSRWVDEETSVVSYEKVKTPKGELSTFHVERTVFWRTINTEIYFYSPKAKANVVFALKAERWETRMTLVDFGVSD